MKRYIFSMIAMALCLMSANAQTVSVADVILHSGETKVVSINLENTQSNIVSFQMDLSLPDGITINKASCELGSRITDEDQELVIGKQPNGSIRLTSTSYALTPIAGTSGEIIKLSLSAANDAKGGTASLSNIKLATRDSQKLTLEDASSKIGVTYKLTYKVDDEIFKTDSIVYNSALTPIAAPTKEGYTFSGWSDIPATMPAQDVTISGKFSVNSYFLFYVLDGNVYKALSVKYGTEIIPEVVPEKEGYTFGGWTDLPKTMPAQDITIQGKYNVNKYVLTYKVDGEVYKTLSIAYGTALTLENAPTKEGYTFSGWSEIPTMMPANDVVITGTFTVNNYSLTYKIDGEVYKTSSVAYGTALTPETAPTKEGYTFSGWSEIPATMPANDVVITGTFSVNNYTLTYKVDGKVYKTSSVAYGTVLTPETAPTKEGYTFSGWSEIPATMPASDVVITGTFSVNNYTLTYKVDGQVYKTSSVAYGTALTPENAPTKEGYTFSGWSEIPTTMPANDVIITGTFSVNNYTLTYKVDGEVYKTSSVAYGTALTPETAPTKEGYTFSGWSEIPTTMSANDVVITGTFSINQYTMTFVLDNGEENLVKKQDYASALTAPENLMKTGFTFKGWSPAVPATVPASDMTFTAQWERNKYLVTFIVEDTIVKKDSVLYEGIITKPADPVKTGYTFVGWQPEVPETMPANDVVITGTFSVNNYTLTYKVDGKVYKTSSVAYGTALTPEYAPTKEGYTFSGWSEIPATMPASDVVITGTFTVNNYTLTYKVDGEVYKTSSVAYGTSITPETAPTKEGYTFSGWSEIPTTMPANDVIITGTFSVNNYTLTYKVDGEVYKTSSVAYGTSITPETAPTKEGYTFSGWSEIPATMPANDIVITGTFSINQYTMTFVLDNSEENLVKEQDYASVLTAPENLVKTGFTFKGWSPTVPASVPASDMTFTAQWERNKYLVTFIVEDSVVKKDSVLYEGIITKPTDPAKEGYTFSGWSEIPETMPANDVVITGTFTVNTYTVTFMYNDKVLKVDSVEYGAKITLPSSLDDERYALVEWLDVPETMPAHDITIYASITDGIRNVSDDIDYKIYDERGQQIPRMKRGLNIIKYNNGTTRKVIVK